MKEKQIKKAINEVLNERNKNNSKFLSEVINKLIFVCYTAMLPVCYWIIFYKEYLATSTFIWATGALTTIWLYHLYGFFPDKEQKEVKNE